MLIVAVVVHGDNAASDVGVGADGGVAEVAQMAGLGAVSEARLFGLDKVADAIVSEEFGAGAQMRERADFRLLADDAIFGAHSQLQMASRADGHVAEPRGAVDSHAF